MRKDGTHDSEDPFGDAGAVRAEAVQCVACQIEGRFEEARLLPNDGSACRRRRGNASRASMTRDQGQLKGTAAWTFREVQTYRVVKMRAMYVNKTGGVAGIKIESQPILHGNWLQKRVACSQSTFCNIRSIVQHTLHSLRTGLPSRTTAM